MLHGHGDDAYRYGQNFIADFSTNVWSGGEPIGLKEHLFRQWHRIEKYPEVLGESLAQKVAQHHGVAPGQILVCNGTTESIYLIAQAFRGKSTTIAIPAFAEYEDACRMHQHQLEFIEWDDLFALSQLQTDLFFICNPNNPTGSVFLQLAELLGKNPETLFILDEAFIQFTRSLKTAIPLLSQYSNLVILRSMTKAFAIPGLRLGYIVANEKLINQLKSFKLPWSVNTLALEAGKYIFDNYEALQLPIRQILKAKEDFVTQLQQQAILKINESHTHFFLAQTNVGTAAQLKQYLISQFGLLIREAGNFRGLGEKHIRLATLTPDKNQLLLQALTQWKIHCS